MQYMQTRLCPECGLDHSKKVTSLGIPIEAEDLAGLRLIRNHLGCTRQALSASNIGAGATQEQVNLFVQGLTHALASYQLLQDEWWQRMRTKYKLPQKDIAIIWETGEFGIAE